MHIKIQNKDDFMCNKQEPNCIKVENIVKQATQYNKDHFNQSNLIKT